MLANLGLQHNHKNNLLALLVTLGMACSNKHSLWVPLDQTQRRGASVTGRGYHSLMRSLSYLGLATAWGHRPPSANTTCSWGAPVTNGPQMEREQTKPASVSRKRAGTMDG